MFLFYVLSFFKKGDIIQGRTLIKEIQYLHSNSTQILALEKNVFFQFFGFKKIFFFVKKVLCNFSVRTLQCFQIFFLNFFLPWKSEKNGPQKLLIIGPDPFIPQSSPDHSPLPRIDFSYYEISGPDICFLICSVRSIEISRLFTTLSSEWQHV